MVSALEDISFLARSENRVRVLQAIAERTRARHELRENLAIARTTFGRVLNELESRGLIQATDGEYSTTPAADAILSKFNPLLETVEGIQALGEAIAWLPPPAHAIDFRHLRDATVTTSSVENPAEPFDRGLQLIRDADTYLGLTSTAIPSYVDALLEGHARGRLDFDGVIEASFLDTLRGDPERAAQWLRIADAGLTWVYDGRIPINLHIVDETVLIWLGERREDGLDIKGLLESTNPAVLSWAEALYADYRSAAEPLEASMVPDPPSSET